MLFKTEEIKKPVIKKVKSTAAYSIKKKIRIEKKIGMENEKVSQVIGEIKKNYFLCFVTAGEWSQHNLINHILDNIGNASIVIVSWSVSNPALDYMLNIIQRGKIDSIKMLLDWRVKIRCTNLKACLKLNNVEVRFSNCHAKMLMVKNDEYSITVFSSANLTNNPRLESGVLFENKDVYDFNIRWINEEFNNANPFEIKKRKKDVN